MPGIVGLITRKPKEAALHELLQMVGTVRHEAFHVSGTWADPSLGVYVGWVARKGSFSDGMPLWNEQKDTVLVFSGEEYSEQEIGKKHSRKVRDPREPEASYLVDLCEEGGSFPADLNGRFHGLLVDRRCGKVMLFNDRYGMHRVCYHESKDSFYFAAEPKAILAVRPELRTIIPRSLGEFVSCGAVLENRTLFKDIYVLPCGSAWVFRNGSIEQRGHYFNPQDWENQERLDFHSYYAELREVWERIVPRYFAGSERVAMSLTGGLDSRAIMAWQRLQPGSLACYTVGSVRHETQDVRVAQEVSKACNQPHHVISAGQDFLSQFDSYAARTVYLTDGCVDVSRSPDLYINEKARDIAPVRLTGNCGGEILRQVCAFKPEGPLAGLFQPSFLQHVNQAAQTYQNIVRGHPVSFAVFRQVPWYHHSVLSLDDVHLSIRSPYIDNDVVRTVFRAPFSALTNSEACLQLIADGNRTLSEIPTDRGLAKRKNRLLRVGARSFRELQFKAEYIYDTGLPQWLARIDRTFSGLRFDRLFLGRHKAFHFRIWYRDSLGRYLKEMLLDPISLSRPYVDAKAVETIVCRHVSGEGNYTHEIHKLLTLELLHRLFVDAKSTAQVAQTDFCSVLSSKVT